MIVSVDAFVELISGYEAIEVYEPIVLSLLLRESAERRARLRDCIDDDSVLAE